MPTTPHDHIVTRFDTELDRLRGEIQRMGELALAQLDAAIDGLQRRDSAAAEQIIAGDGAIDALESEVGHDVLHLLALRQPMARDLRAVYAALKIAADIERIGDYAANAAKRSIAINHFAALDATANLRPLAELATALVRDALRAYREGDAERAMRVRNRDVELDALHTAFHRSLLTYLMEDPTQLTPGIHLLFIAKNIERIGDHATNIAENTWFLVNGEPIEGSRAKGDRSSELAVP